MPVITVDEPVVEEETVSLEADLPEAPEAPVIEVEDITGENKE